jgi:DNA-binding MarR family transcriptional regulator
VTYISPHDIYLPTVPNRPLSDTDYYALAELRYRLRTFISFSEEQARTVGLEPRQHQLLLTIRGLRAEQRPTIGTLADRLVVKHHTVVELVDRLERIHLVERTHDPEDGRVVLVNITQRGRAMLERLTLAHRAELAKTAPALLESLQTIMRAV